MEGKSFGRNGLQDYEVEREARRTHLRNRGRASNVAGRPILDDDDEFECAKYFRRMYQTKTTGMERGVFVRGGGGLYTIYRGLFGGKNVLFKVAELASGNNDQLVRNDVDKTMDVQGGTGAVRILHCDVEGAVATVVTEQCHKTLSELFVSARITDVYMEFKAEDIFRGMITTLNDLRESGIHHGDLRLSKMFIVKKRKLSRIAYQIF